MPLSTYPFSEESYSDYFGAIESSSDDAVMYLDTATDYSNVSVQAVVSGVEEDDDVVAGWAIRFRRSDENNYWEFGFNTVDGTYVLRKKVDGDFFIEAEPGTEYTVEDLIRIDAYEERINCYINNNLVATVSDTDLMNNQHVGIRITSGAIDSRLDAFYAMQLLTDIRNNLPLTADYEILVDWDNDGGLTLGDFDIDHIELLNTEEEFDGWDTVGSRPATLEISRERVKSGTYALKATWEEFNLFQFDVSGHGFGEGQFGGDEFANPPNCFKFAQAGQGFDDGVFAVTRDEANPDLIPPIIYKTIDKLVPGREYTLQAWVWVPTGNTAVGMQIAGIDSPVYTTLNDQWEQLTFTYTATAIEHDIEFTPFDENPTTGNWCFIDEIQNHGAHENITCYVLGVRTPLRFRSGKDQARSLASISPGEVELECDNTSGLFSPDNPGSALFGYLVPGRPVTIRATYNDQNTSIFHGFIDNYVLNPNPDEKSVTFTCMDGLQYLSNAIISTDMYPSIQTGEAVNILLDAVNWPEHKRKIEHGATTIRWWWVEDEDGLSALQDIVQAEGLPSTAYVDEFGNFCFESRHHRLLHTRSTTVQTSLRSCMEFDEPNFSGPISYDIGWKDIINRVDVDVEERGPKEFGDIWTSEDLLVIPAGTSKNIKVKADTPFFGAVTPTIGYEDVVENDKDTGKDIILKTGSGTLASIQLTKDSGESTELQLTAGASDVTIKKIRIQGFPVETITTRKVFEEDPESVTLYGAKSADSNQFTLAGINDVEAIARLTLDHRSTRLPVVNIKLNNGHPIRLSNIFNRKLGDRVHIEEMLQTFMNDDYIIEVIEHEISNSGMAHVTTLGCEKARDQRSLLEEDEDAPPTFTFDVVGQGFDDGYFSDWNGLSLSDNLFILDQSRLNEDGLGF